MIKNKSIWLTAVLIILFAAILWWVFSDFPSVPESKDSVREKHSGVNNDRFSSNDSDRNQAKVTRVPKPVLEKLAPRLPDYGIVEKNDAFITGMPDNGAGSVRKHLYQTKNGDTLWDLSGRWDSYDDSFRWPLLYLQNRQQIEHIIYNSSTQKWIAKLTPSSGLKLAPNPQLVKPVKGSIPGNRYAVQILALSKEKRNSAYAITRKLIKSGYCAYLYKTREKIYAPSLGKEIYFYRIRVGPFKNASEAMNAGEMILHEMSGTGFFTRNYWVATLSEREMSGRQFDFGVQRRHPWVLQISQNQKLRQALHTLSMFEDNSDFAYIKETPVPSYGKRYAVRVGFFSSQKAVLDRVNTLQQKTGYQLEQYLPIELFDPFELIPANF